MLPRALGGAFANAVSIKCLSGLALAEGAGVGGAARAAVARWTAAAACSTSSGVHQQQPQWPWLQQHHQQQRRALSTGSGAGGDAGGGSSPGDEAASQMLGMMQRLMDDPTTRGLLLSRMPPHMRRPEVVRAMMANPEVRQRIAALAEQTGLHKMMANLPADRIAAGIDATRKAGMDPGALFAKFASSPTLSAKLKDPRVLAALTDVVSNGPDALKKYSGDRPVVEAWMEAAEIIERQQQADAAIAAAAAEAAPLPPTPPGSPAGGGGPEGLAAARAALGVSPEELMARVAARPELVARVRDPEVQAALAEVAAAPWKVVKHLLNRRVMGALKEMRDVLKEARSGQS